MASRSRVNTLARIRYRNKKLDPSEQIRITRGEDLKEIRKIEKTLEAKITLSEAGINTRNIGKLETQTAERLGAVGRSLKSGNKSALARNVTKLAKSTAGKLEAVNEQLKDVQGFGNIDFINSALTQRKLDPKSKLLEEDTKLLIEAITEKDFVPENIKRLTDQVNNALRLQGLNTITFDEFELEDTISKLNAVDQRTKNIARYVEFDEDIVEGVEVFD